MNQSLCWKLKCRSIAQAGPLDSISYPHLYEPRALKALHVQTIDIYDLECLPHHCPEIKNIDKLSPFKLMYTTKHKVLKKSHEKFMKDLQEECDEEHCYIGKVIDKAEMTAAKMNQLLMIVRVSGGHCSYSAAI